MDTTTMIDDIGNLGKPQEERCPHCGYCPHCKRSNPAPVPWDTYPTHPAVPYYPTYPTWPWTDPVWAGVLETTTTGGRFDAGGSGDFIFTNAATSGDTTGSITFSSDGDDDITIRLGAATAHVPVYEACNTPSPS